MGDQSGTRRIRSAGKEIVQVGFMYVEATVEIARGRGPQDHERMGKRSEERWVQTTRAQVIDPLACCRWFRAGQSSMAESRASMNNSGRVFDVGAEPSRTLSTSDVDSLTLL